MKLVLVAKLLGYRAGIVYCISKRCPCAGVLVNSNVSDLKVSLVA